MLRIPYEVPGPREIRAFFEARHREIEEKLKDPRVRAELEAARAEAARAARLLREEFGATRVRLFGSLARMDAVEGYDIDLAAEGIPPERFFRAWVEAEKVVTRKLDLVDVKDAPPLLRARIEQDGVDLP